MKIYVHAATSNTKNLTLGSILTVDELSKYITHPDDLEKFNTYVTPDLYDSLESAINDPKGALEVPTNYPIKDFRLSDGYNGDTPIWVFHRRNDDCVRIDYSLECRVGGFYYIYMEICESVLLAIMVRGEEVFGLCLILMVLIIFVQIGLIILTKKYIN